jgi:Excalibur calcium-binding domain
MSKRNTFLGIMLVLLLTSGLAAPRKYPNCEALNRDFPHGIGLKGATDRNKAGNPMIDPVTDFAINPDVYKAHKGLDRDKDDIACERH